MDKEVCWYMECNAAKSALTDLIKAATMVQEAQLHIREQVENRRKNR